MDADEQIGLHAARFFHAHLQWHKKISIACEEGAHGQQPVFGFDDGVVDAFTQAMRDLQHHIFFFGAVGANRTGVFATVPRVECDDDDAIGGYALCLCS